MGKKRPGKKGDLVANDSQKEKIPPERHPVKIAEHLAARVQNLKLGNPKKKGYEILS